MALLKKEACYSSFIVFSRILLSVIFIASGLEKLIHPTEEFMLVIKGYHLIPDLLIRPMAISFPWLELIFGTFLLIGLFYPLSVIMIGLLLLAFTVAIGSTLVRGIPLEDCGCFKSFGFKENGPTALVRNAILLLFWLNLYFQKQPIWTIDQWLRKED
ncbi:MAG: MauE/DoxX family redox-associated membrane protein [Nitrospiria bacterium]